jgi:hypothetical protein
MIHSHNKLYLLSGGGIQQLGYINRFVKVKDRSLVLLMVVQ